MITPGERERRLRNLNDAVGEGLQREIERNKDSLSGTLIQDFRREITMADTCVYNDDLEGALYHGLIADMIHRNSSIGYIRANFRKSQHVYRWK